MLDIDALVPKSAIFDMCCIVVSVIMLRDKNAFENARTSREGFIAAQNMAHKSRRER